MSRLDRVFTAGTTWLGRLYGVAFFAIGFVFLYWAGRGFLAYANGIRAAWTEPWACLIGLVAGVASWWVGFHLVKDRALARQFVAGRDRSDELSKLADEFSRLEDTDPVAARQLLEGDLSRETAKAEARRAQLRERSYYDVDAAIALRRELQKEIKLNAEFRKNVVKKWPAEQREPMLAEIDRTDLEYQSQIRELDGRIEELRLR
jgi:hypothetical protein